MKLCALWGTAISAPQLISLISETMTGTLKARSKSCFLTGSRAVSIFNQALIQKLISSSPSPLGERRAGEEGEKRDVELLTTYLVLMG